MFRVQRSKFINIGVGSVFIIAAILKLISIDEFEIYIYSFNILSFLITTFVSRIIIAAEFALGLLLILNRNCKFIRRITLILLASFTLFLIYTAIFRHDSNCHCFGELIQLNPMQSIIKNLILIVFLIIGKQSAISYQQSESIVSVQCSESESESEFRVGVRVRVKLLLVLLSCGLLVFIVSPPDSIYKMIYSTEKEVSSIDLYASFDEVVKIDFKENEVVFDSIPAFNINEERQLIAIVSSGCKYCRLGLKKLSLIMKNEGVSPDNVDIFIWGSPEGIIDFRSETMTEDFDYWHIMPNQAIKITYGRFPVFIWIKEKEIVKTGDFRDIY